MSETGTKPDALTMDLVQLHNLLADWYQGRQFALTDVCEAAAASGLDLTRERIETLLGYMDGAGAIREVQGCDGVWELVERAAPTLN